jgi:UDP-glucose 4-epimerase
MIDPSPFVGGASFLVTGGAGFIGCHTIDALVRSGAQRVVVVDNLSTGRWDHVVPHPSVERITADLAAMSERELQDALRGVDYLLHLAAEKHNNAIDAPQRVLAVNVDATFRLFRAAAAAPVRKVIFTSSLYATGRMTLPPMREDDLPEPATVYGVSKLAGEHLLRHFAAQESLRWTALRLFFVYGPKQFAGSGYKSVIVTNFDRILRNEQPVIFGDGTQSLDYVYIDDVTRALLAGLSDAADGEVVNVGTGKAISVNQLTDCMLEVARSSLRPVHAPADWTAGTHRVCDNAKAKRLLGWSPAISMGDGLAGVYSWMKTAW